MNKIKFLFVFTILALVSGSAQAQKTGYIRIEDLLRVMPETGKIQPVLEKYQSDSLQPRFNYTLSEYQRKDSIVNGKDSSRTPAAVRNKMREEMQDDLYELQNWQSIVSNLMQSKQDELLQPIYTKAFEAIQQVAKENGYSYVYSKDALLVAPPADDLLPLVAKKLKITLPGTTGTGTGTTPANPGTATPKKQ
jgi:outer membrane protein